MLEVEYLMHLAENSSVCCVTLLVILCPHLPLSAAGAVQLLIYPDAYACCIWQEMAVFVSVDWRHANYVFMYLYFVI